MSCQITRHGYSPRGNAQQSAVRWKEDALFANWRVVEVVAGIREQISFYAHFALPAHCTALSRCWAARSVINRAPFTSGTIHFILNSFLIYGHSRGFAVQPWLYSNSSAQFQGWVCFLFHHCSFYRFAWEWSSEPIYQLIARSMKRRGSSNSFKTFLYHESL